MIHSLEQWVTILYHDISLTLVVGYHDTYCFCRLVHKRNTHLQYIPVSTPVSPGGEMKAGLGYKWDSQCLHQDDQYTVYYMMYRL